MQTMNKCKCLTCKSKKEWDFIPSGGADGVSLRVTNYCCECIRKGKYTPKNIKKQCFVEIDGGSFDEVTDYYKTYFRKKTTNLPTDILAIICAYACKKKDDDYTIVVDYEKYSYTLATKKYPLKMNGDISRCYFNKNIDPPYFRLSTSFTIFNAITNNQNKYINTFCVIFHHLNSKYRFVLLKTFFKFSRLTDNEKMKIYKHNNKDVEDYHSVCVRVMLSKINTHKIAKIGKEWRKNPTLIYKQLKKWGYMDYKIKFIFDMLENYDMRKFEWRRGFNVYNFLGNEYEKKLSEKYPCKMYIDEYVKPKYEIKVIY